MHYLLKLCIYDGNHFPVLLRQKVRLPLLWPKIHLLYGVEIHKNEWLRLWKVIICNPIAVLTIQKLSTHFPPLSLSPHRQSSSWGFSQRATTQRLWLIPRAFHFYTMAVCQILVSCLLTAFLGIIGQMGVVRAGTQPARFWHTAIVSLA